MQYSSHAELHWTSRVEKPAQRPRIHEVHAAAVPVTSTGVSFGEGVVIAMGPVAAWLSLVITHYIMVHCCLDQISSKDVHTLLNIPSNSSTAASERLFIVENE